MTLYRNVLDYLSRSNITTAILITVMSNFAFEMVTSLLNDIIMPLIDKNSNNVSDVDELRNLTTKFMGKDIRIGMFIRSLIRFGIAFMVILIFVAFIADSNSQ